MKIRGQNSAGADNFLNMTSAVQNIFLAINQPLTETGIAKILSETSQYNLRSDLYTKETIFQRVREQRPHLLIVDYSYPQFFSLEDLQSILQSTERLNVLVISSYDDRESVRQCVQMGIKGYITKNCTKNEFLLAVESTSRGEKFFSSKILDILLENRLDHEPEQDQSNLTAREKEMLTYLAKGYSTQRIADTLFLSPHTVQTHRKSIIRKLKVKSPTEFVIHALDLGLITQK